VPTFTLAGRSFELEPDDIEDAVADIAPDPVRAQFVVVRGRRYPPRQVVSCATGLRRKAFTIDRARTVLKQLGFDVGRAQRRPELVLLPGEGALRGRQATVLEPYMGKWVALAGPLEVLVAGDTPQEVLIWLAQNGRRAEYGVFRLPHAEEEVVGPH